MAMLTKDDVLKSDDLKREIVKVPEWGGDILIKTISGTDKDKYEMSIIDAKGNMKPNIRAKLLIASCINEDGSLMFTERDIVHLGQKSAIALDRVFAAAQKLNAVNEADVEALAKN
jgi:hypothetical protein